jgi:hypothetical protein
MRNLMDKLKWYDYVVVGIHADVLSALIMSVLVNGAYLNIVTITPLLVLSWLAYENIRKTSYDKEPD